MEAHDLVRRVRAHDDRRNVCVELTERGDAMLDLLSVFHRAELRSVAPALWSAIRALRATQHGMRSFAGGHEGA
jgi:DNA-binding MarR family transcriptional regulator